jgi:hypothetical protein
LKVFLLKISFLICFSLTCVLANAATYSQRLERIYQAYQALGQPKDVQHLVELDAELRALGNEIEAKDTAGKTRSIWKSKYASLGIYVGHYSDSIGYSGKLLVEAHKIDPHSIYRERTMFSSILGVGSSHGLGKMPNVGQAKKYLQEFPEGAFTDEANFILGSFYDDKAKVLRDLRDPKYEKDYKYDCFKPYLSKDTYETQQMQARRSSILHLSKAITQTTELAKKKRIREELAEVKNSTSSGWYWCAD